MLGPPGTVTTGVGLPAGRPSTTNCTGSRSTHRTLLVLPSIRGLEPATSLPAKTKATAWPVAAAAHGTGQGLPLVTDHPACAHCGGSSFVSTVPAQPPVVDVMVLGVAGIDALPDDWLQAATSSSISAHTAIRDRGPMA